MDLPARFLNHSCEPNVAVGGVNDRGSYDFIALRDIDAGEVSNMMVQCATWFSRFCIMR